MPVATSHLLRPLSQTNVHTDWIAEASSTHFFQLEVLGFEEVVLEQYFGDQMFDLKKSKTHTEALSEGGEMSSSLESKVLSSSSTIFS